MQRRRFIALCIGAGLISAAPVYYLATKKDASDAAQKEDADFVFLNHQDTLIFTALVPIFVGETAQDTALLGETQINQVVANIDGLMGSLPQRSRDEVRELLDVLSLDASRIMAAGMWRNWEDASNEDKRAFLMRWRDSWFALFQKAYHGLHQIILGSYYAESASWKILAYPGPPNFSA